MAALNPIPLRSCASKVQCNARNASVGFQFYIACPEQFSPLGSIAIGIRTRSMFEAGTFRPVDDVGQCLQFDLKFPR